MERQIIPMMRHVFLHDIDNSYVGTLKTRGQYNGYLAIPAEYSDIIKDETNPYTLYDLIAEVQDAPHGGVTYCHEEKDDFFYDGMIPLIDIYGMDRTNYIIIGFDTAHFGDTWEKWTAKQTYEETMRFYIIVKQYIESHLTDK